MPTAMTRKKKRRALNIADSWYANASTSHFLQRCACGAGATVTR